MLYEQATTLERSRIPQAANPPFPEKTPAK
jgi:hypothetical protein